MSRVLVIGIDGGTFDLVRPWTEAGDLPHIGRLMAEGVHGPLESTLPPVTAPAWTTFATGKNPGKHGVFDFIRPMGRGRFDLVNASAIRAQTLWQILSEAGRRVGVMNVPVTYPPTPVNGFVIGGMLSPTRRTGSGKIAYPADLLDRYAGQLPPYRVAPHVQYKPGNEEVFVADLLELVDLRGAYALQLMADHPYDFLMFHFLSTDTIQHALWKFVDPDHPRYEPQAAARFGDGIKQVYQRIDHYVGQIIDRVSEDTTVILMSDHGFGPLHYVVNLNLFLIDKGLMRLKRDPWTRIKTGLFRAGVTPAAIWHLIERTGLQNYVWQVSKSTRNKVVSKFLSFDDVDWSRTVAYSIGHVGQIYVNLKGREPEGVVEPGEAYERVRRQIIDSLHELRHPETKQPLVDANAPHAGLIPGDEVTHGPYAAQGPDLHLVMDGYRTIAFPLFATDSKIVTRQIRGDSGCHRMHGILIAWGPEIRSKALSNARILDLAPTILHLLGLPVPGDMDGRVLTEALSSERPVEFREVGPDEERANAQLSAEETAEVEERLRDLGYLG
jgi:predicted AlkP superfamily phosphohydrolase/phosphomutase